MSSEWLKTTLGEFVRLQRGHDLTASEQQPGPYPVMGSAGPNGSHNVAKVKGPGVVVGRSGASMGRVHYSESDYWPHNTCLYVTDFQGNNSRFAYYALSSLDLAGYNSGSAQPSLNRNYIYGMPLRIPSRAEQDAIVEILSGLDDRITLLRESNTTLEAIAQALFKSWFVDFDPVRAKAEGRVRQDGERSGQPRMPQASDLPRPGAEAGAEAQGQQEGAIQGCMSAAEGTTAGMPEVGQRREQLPRMPKAAMDAATAALFPDSFEESELGLVPKGWTVKPVGDAVDCLGGGTPDTKEPSYWEPAEHCWTTPKDLSGLQSPVLLQTERRLSTLGLAKVSSGLLPAGTLLMSSRAPIGYLAIAQMPVAVNQGYIAIPPGGELSPVYMLFWCRQNMEGIKGRANGSTFMEISKKAFRPIPALVPPAEVLDAFESMAGPLFERLVENERQAQTLTQLRDTLLPRLISGQLRLPEIGADIDGASA